MTRGARTVGAALLVLGLAGCTGDAAPAGPSGDGAPAAVEPVEPSSASSPDPLAGGVDPAELSREVLDAAAATQDSLPVLASQTVEAPLGLTADDTGDVVVDVRRVERRADSTLVTLSMAAAEVGTELAPDAFSDRRNLDVFQQLTLTDTEAGADYLPLSWRRWISTPDNLALDGPTNTCVCPTRRLLRLGPDPVLMDVLYGPLPQGVATVSVSSPDGLLGIADVPVHDAVAP